MCVFARSMRNHLHEHVVVRRMFLGRFALQACMRARCFWMTCTGCSFVILLAVLKGLKCPTNRYAMDCNSGATLTCKDCGSDVHNCRSRTYRFTDTETGWCYWTCLCSQCDRAQWRMYRKLEPRPQMCGHDTYSYIEWDEQYIAFSQWLIQQLHVRPQPVV